MSYNVDVGLPIKEGEFWYVRTKNTSALCLSVFQIAAVYVQAVQI